MANKVNIKSNEKRKRAGIVQFFIDLKAEFKRVTWPAKVEAKKLLAL